jgi:hypothetical protein
MLRMVTSFLACAAPDRSFCVFPLPVLIVANLAAGFNHFRQHSSMKRLPLDWQGLAL